MNRDLMHRLVRSKDEDGRISLRSIFGDPVDAAKVKYVANETAWNGKWYECHFCHEEFRSLNGLNSHLNSQVRTYHTACHYPTWLLQDNH